MSDWAWVAFAYGVTLVTIAGYSLLLGRRSRHTRRRLEGGA
ncbi:MAG: CcmD family protein [Acidimicrobiia bacterium]|nr:CcmD family protein [Acidimicrobiia bacterium]